MGSVPNTNTFSLQDVVDVVNPSIHTLQHSFDESIPEYFDPTYEGNKDRLSNFRNYTIPSIGDVIICQNSKNIDKEVNYPLLKR